jgi:hypothetical protein
MHGHYDPEWPIIPTDIAQHLRQQGITITRRHDSCILDSEITQPALSTV